MPRLFFAIQPRPHEARAMLEAARPCAGLVGATLVHAADVHLTLCFLGEIDAEAMPGFASSADAHVPALQVAMPLLDYWEGSSVLCLTGQAGGGLDHVVRLAAQLGGIARAAGVSIDARPFRPHVTLARRCEIALARMQRWPIGLSAPLAFTTDRLALMQSTPGTTPRYSTLRHWPLPHLPQRS